MHTTAPLLTNSNAGTQDGTIVDNSEMRLPVTGSVLDDDIISEFNTAQAAIDKFKNGKGDGQTMMLQDELKIDKGGRRRGSRSAKKRLTKRKRNKKSHRRRKSRRVN